MVRITPDDIDELLKPDSTLPVAKRMQLINSLKLIVADYPAKLEELKDIKDLYAKSADDAGKFRQLQRNLKLPDNH